MSQEFHGHPYFDDFRVKGNDGLPPADKYYRVLYRPSVALQARELNTMQAMQQEQVARFGQSIYKEGAMVLPGGTSVNVKFDYVKLKPTVNTNTDVGAYYKDFIGKYIKGKNSGVIAQVVDASPQEENSDGQIEPITLFVKYQNSGDDGTQKTFINDEIITSDVPDFNPDGNIGRLAVVHDTGYGSSFSVEEGVYFIGGKFVKVQKETIIIAKFSDTPNCLVGFEVTEKLITEAQDPSLNDNAAGSTNATAPGAHRYEVSLKLATRPKPSITEIEFLNAGTQPTPENSHTGGAAPTLQQDDNFVLLAVIDDGKIRSKKINNEYSVIKDYMAQRTYDESGNYTVRPFILDVQEHFKTKTNGGVYTQENGGDKTKLAVGLDRGKAYVNGYDYETLMTTHVSIDKGRDTEKKQNVAVPFTFGSYLVVKNINGLPDIDQLQEINLRDKKSTSRGVPGGTNPTNVIGTANVRAIAYHAGDISDINNEETKFKLFIFNIKMKDGSSLVDVKGVNAEGAEFSADVDLDAKGQATLFDPQKSSMLIEFPYNAVKSLKDEQTNIGDTHYEARKMYNGTLTTEGIAVIPAANGGAFEPPYDNTKYILSVKKSSGEQEIINLQAGTNIEVQGAERNTIQINLGSSYSSASYNFYAAYNKNQTLERTKTLLDETQDFDYNSQLKSVIDEITSGTKTNSDLVLKLKKADIHKIEGIYMSTNPGVPATGSEADFDITNNFIFDNGQRDDYYDYGTLTLANGAQLPKANIHVKFKYFQHSTGSYFSADSYANIPYDDIPLFNSTNGILSLADVLDFRPTIGQNNKFSSSTAYIPELPNMNALIYADCEYYLPRIDKIYLSSSGKFGVTRGVSSLNPNEPVVPENTMELYTLYIPPYTFSPNQVVTKMTENKRYTMRDIGRLEKRINSLEYYTSLSFLEKETADLKILDENNVDRFKNGFLVDTFANFNSSDTSSRDFAAAMDEREGRLRPMFHVDNTKLKVDTGASDATIMNNQAFVPFTNIEYLKQPYSSYPESVTPFLVFTWKGEAQLNPDSDVWHDTNRKPELIVQDNSLADLMDSIQEANPDIFGLKWSDWENSWTGKVENEKEIRRNSRISTSSGFFGSGNNRATTTTTTRVLQGTESGIASREGIRNVLKRNGNNSLSFGDRIVSIDYIPYVRSRKLTFKVYGLKPNTRVYPFFENQAVEHLCKQISKSEYDNEDSLESVSNNSAWQKFNSNDNPAQSAYHPDLIDDVFKTDGIATPEEIKNAIDSKLKLVTDEKGELYGEFWIPNNTFMAFKVGKRTLKICDDVKNRTDWITTFANVDYEAKGLTSDVQNVALRSPSISIGQDTISEQRDISRTKTRNSVTSRTSFWYRPPPPSDPLAQSFSVDLENGGFITGVDLYFYTKDDKNIPVNVDIRQMENGVPTEKVVPFSKTFLYAEDVLVSDDASTATQFKFDNPIYLEGGKEYALVVSSSSTKYKVFVSKLGENDTLTGQRIISQPATGSLFKSQNASTWSASQFENLKFTIYRAKFNVNQNKTVVLANSETSVVNVLNPFNTTLNSNKVLVKHYNHGLIEGSKVVFTSIQSDDVNGIPKSELLNKPLTVSKIEQDYYEIETLSQALETGPAGGNVSCLGNKMFDVYYPMSTFLDFQETSVVWQSKLTSGKSLAGNEIPYVLDNYYKECTINSNNSLNQPSLIASSYNENHKLNDRKSFLLKATLTTTDDAISPVIDLTRCAIITVNNRIDNPQGASDSDPNKNVVHNFVDETKPFNNSSLGRYITGRVNLNAKSSVLKILFRANRPSEANIDVYFRTQAPGDTRTFADIPWVKAKGELLPQSSEDKTIFSDYEYLNEEIDPFVSFQVKIVMTSKNSSKVPILKDFRAIALAV